MRLPIAISPLLRPPPTSIRLTEAVEALDVLKRTQQDGQEQLCDPLVPLNTYWYLTASPELMSAVSDRMAAALKRRSR